MCTAHHPQQAAREQRVDEKMRVSLPRSAVRLKEDRNSDARQTRTNPEDTELSARIPLIEGPQESDPQRPGRGRRAGVSGGPCQSGEMKQCWDGRRVRRPHNNMNTPTATELDAQKWLKR